MKHLHSLFCPVAALLFAASCQIAEVGNADKVMKQLIITAGLENDGAILVDGEEVAPETKTVRQLDGAVWWTPGDAISIFYGSDMEVGTKFTNTATEPVSRAAFSGNIGVITGSGENTAEATSFWGVYPYDPSIKCDGTKVTMTIPSTQASAEGTFAVGQWPTIGRAQALALSFKNICCGYKFKVESEGIERIYIESSNGEKMTGLIDVTFDSDGIPVATGVESASWTNVEVMPEGGGAFKPGKYYYVALIPQDYSGGVRWTFYKANEYALYTCDVTGSKPEYPSGRNKFKVMDNKDHGLRWYTNDYVAVLPSGEEFNEILFKEFKDLVWDESLHAIGIQFLKGVQNPSGKNIATSGPGIYVSYDSSEDVIYVQTSAYDLIAPEDVSFMFSNLGVQYISLGNVDFSRTKSFYACFINCENLEEIYGLSYMDTSQATDMSCMFAGCNSLVSLDLSTFDMKNVTDVRSMFQDCWCLEDLDISSFDNARLSYFRNMFRNCTALESLDLSCLHTASPVVQTNASYMFYGCSRLSEITFAKDFVFGSNVEAILGLISSTAGDDYRTGVDDPDGDGIFTKILCTSEQAEVLRWDVNQKQGSVSAGKYRFITPDLPGQFTVSSTGKKVMFSRGLLVATVNSAGKLVSWDFQEAQYRMDGSDPAKVIADGKGGLVNCFGWSTDATDYGVSASGFWNTYSGDFKDWGIAYCESNGLPAGTWRTLSNDEFHFALTGRTNASAKTGYGMIGRDSGFILLPDSFVDPMKNGGNGAFVPCGSPQDGEAPDFSRNVYTIEGWTEMEEAGAVFFPNLELLWTSDASSETHAYVVDLSRSDSNLTQFRSSKNIVRLVTDVK